MALSLLKRLIKGSPITASEHDANMTAIETSVNSKQDAIGAMAIGNINSPLLDMPLKNSLAMKTGVGSATFTRASTATYIDRYGVLKTAAINEPRFEEEGYLNEGGSTNLLTYSERLWDTAYWGVGTTLANYYTVTNETVLASPYGVADSKVAKFVANATTSMIFLRKSSLSLPSGVYTGSIWLYVPTQSGITSFSFLNDYSDADNSSYVTYTTFDTWVRVRVTATLTATRTTIDFNILPNGTTPPSGFTFYAFGAQLEALPFATSYIPTTSATVTRAVDSLVVTYENNIPNATNSYSVVVDSKLLGLRETTTTQDQYIWRVYGENYRMLRRQYHGQANSVMSYNHYSDIVYDAGTDIAKRRFAAVFNANGTRSLFSDGVLKVTSSATIGSITQTATKHIQIGGFDTTNHKIYGHISNFRIYDKALSSNEVALA